MLRRTVQAMLVLVLAGSAARAQSVVLPGSTPEGEYLRAMGIYNERTAVANEINANTFIRMNEYMWDVIKNETRENAEHRRARLERDAESKKKLEARIHDHPEAPDVMNGDALNSQLRDLLDPAVSDSTSRYARVPLDASAIRRIPFKVGEKGDRFSMSRLSLKGTKKWAVAFQDPPFASYRRAYQRAVDNALELAIEGKMKAEAIKEVEKVVDDLEDKLKRTPDLLAPNNQRLYSEAKEQVDRLRASARLFKTHKIQQVLGEIDSFAGTTVDDLRLFMRKHSLTFAAADSADEKALYAQLYTALVAQRRKATGAD